MGNQSTFDLHYNLKPASDMDTMQAVSQAENIIEHSKCQIQSAIVDRFDGLVLLAGPIDNLDADGYRLRTPLCGYDGAGSRTAAKILAMFDFGDEASLFARIKTGNRHEFTR